MVPADTVATRLAAARPRRPVRIVVVRIFVIIYSSIRKADLMVGLYVSPRLPVPRQFLTPLAQGIGVELENAIALDAWRRRHERLEPFVDTRALVAIGSRQQVPEGQGVADARHGEHVRQRFVGHAVSTRRIDRLLERGWRVL